MIIDANKFLSYLIFSKHIDGLTCGEVKEAIEMCKVDIFDKLKEEIKQLPTQTRTNWNGCLPDIDYPEIEYVDVTKNELLSILDKYITESDKNDHMTVDEFAELFTESE